MKIGIAGGIGSGKSYVCRRLEARGMTVYDCDAAAKRLIRTSPQLQQQLTAINDIIHPAVFQDFLDSGMEWMESAIMYESGIYQLVDKVVVVTAPEELRIQRIMQRDGISREKALQWIHRQWPQEQVKALADYEIVNDGIADIDSQIDLLLHRLFQNV